MFEILTLNNSFLFMASTGGSVFSRISKFASSMAGWAKGASWAIFLLAVIICGIAWVVGGSGANFAKSTLGRVVVGVAIVSLATAIITTLADAFGNSGKPSFGSFKTSAELLKVYMQSHGLFL